jgi:hypothetical protein
VKSKDSLRCSIGPNTVPILVRLIKFIASYTIALRLSNIIVPCLDMTSDKFTYSYKISYAFLKPHVRAILSPSRAPSVVLIILYYI